MVISCAGKMYQIEDRLCPDFRGLGCTDWATNRPRKVRFPYEYPGGRAGFEPAQAWGNDVAVEGNGLPGLAEIGRFGRRFGRRSAPHQLTGINTVCAASSNPNWPSTLPASPHHALLPPF